MIVRVGIDISCVWFYIPSVIVIVVSGNVTLSPVLRYKLKCWLVPQQAWRNKQLIPHESPPPHHHHHWSEGLDELIACRTIFKSNLWSVTRQPCADGKITSWPTWCVCVYMCVVYLSCISVGVVRLFWHVLPPLPLFTTSVWGIEVCPQVK